jgi:hypothetical protein
MVTTLFTFPACTFSFDPPDTSLGYIPIERQFAKFEIALILVQNDRALQEFPFDMLFQT